MKLVEKDLLLLKMYWGICRVCEGPISASVAGDGEKGYLTFLPVMGKILNNVTDIKNLREELISYFRVESYVMTDGQLACRSVCLGLKHPSGAYDQICVTV
jgi:hypothetical protein